MLIIILAPFPKNEKISSFLQHSTVNITTESNKALYL